MSLAKENSSTTPRHWCSRCHPSRRRSIRRHSSPQTHSSILHPCPLQPDPRYAIAPDNILYSCTSLSYMGAEETYRNTFEYSTLADLVVAISCPIYNGPTFIQQLPNTLTELMADREFLETIRDASRYGMMEDADSRTSWNADDSNTSRDTYRRMISTRRFSNKLLQGMTIVPWSLQFWIQIGCVLSQLIPVLISFFSPSPHRLTSRES